MLTSRKVKRLQEQLQAVTDENTALHGSNKSLLNQRDALVKENNDLRQQIRDLRAEYNEALEAKETERRELCDQLDTAILVHQTKRIIHHNFLSKSDSDNNLKNEQTW